MPDREQPFQYAILRVVPSLSRGEALNVGVVLHCRQRSFLAARTHIDRDRLLALDPGLDIDGLARHLAGIERIAAGDPLGGTLSQLDRSERFGWLVAPSSDLLQPSPVHTGLTTNPEATLSHLAADLVDTAD
jgi:hypothetical protein